MDSDSSVTAGRLASTRFAFAGSIMQRMTGARTQFTLAKVYYPVGKAFPKGNGHKSERNRPFKGDESFRVTDRSSWLSGSWPKAALLI